jgi:hypothetical protein
MTRTKNCSFGSKKEVQQKKRSKSASPAVNRRAVASSEVEQKTNSRNRIQSAIQHSQSQQQQQRGHMEAEKEVLDINVTDIKTMNHSDSKYVNIVRQSYSASAASINAWLNYSSSNSSNSNNDVVSFLENGEGQTNLSTQLHHKGQEAKIDSMISPNIMEEQISPYDVQNVIKNNRLKLVHKSSIIRMNNNNHNHTSNSCGNNNTTNSKDRAGVVETQLSLGDRQEFIMNNKCQYPQPTLEYIVPRPIETQEDIIHTERLRHLLLRQRKSVDISDSNSVNNELNNKIPFQSINYIPVNAYNNKKAKSTGVLKKESIKSNKAKNANVIKHFNEFMFGIL